jgi:hypothetical protein
MKVYQKQKRIDVFSPMDRSLRREMKPVFGNNYWFDTVTYIDLVDLRIKS